MLHCFGKSHGIPLHLQTVLCEVGRCKVQLLLRMFTPPSPSHPTPARLLIPPLKVHGDVFRAPKHLMLFSALFGTGCQLAVLVLVVILFAIAGPLHGDVYEERGEMVSTFIVCYALTSFIAGCVAVAATTEAFWLSPVWFICSRGKPLLVAVTLFQSFRVSSSTGAAFRACSRGFVYIGCLPIPVLCR